MDSVESRRGMMSPNTRTTILCENAIDARVGSGEHGFSAWFFFWGVSVLPLIRL
jgi:hypothetical protein